MFTVFKGRYSRPSLALGHLVYAAVELKRFSLRPTKQQSKQQSIYPVLSDPVLSDVLRPAARSRLIRRRRWLSAQFKNCLAALIAFGVATLLLGQMIPSPAIPHNVVFIGPKYDYYQAHKDEYNTLFFGSSRVYNHIAPDVFDQAANAQTGGSQPDTSQAQLAINSYNFGIPAMRAIDSTVLVDEVLKNPPENLKWVFFETTLDKGFEPIRNARTHRSMYWHTWENTGFAWRYILTSEEPWTSKLPLMTSHLLPALYRQLNVGRLFNQVLPSEFSERERAVAAAFTAEEGYFPLTDESDSGRQEFLQPSAQANYLEQVEALKQSNATAPEVEPPLAKNKQMLLERVVRAVRAAGAEPIFIEPPALSTDRDFAAAQQQGVIEHLLSYRDPEQFPQLYSLDNRWDSSHLTEAAAREFSHLLGEDFARLIPSDPNA